MYNCGESYSEYDISLSDDETMTMTIIVNARVREKFSAMIILRIMMRRHLIMH